MFSRETPSRPTLHFRAAQLLFLLLSLHLSGCMAIYDWGSSRDKKALPLLEIPEECEVEIERNVRSLEPENRFMTAKLDYSKRIERESAYCTIEEAENLIHSTACIAGAKYVLVYNDEPASMFGHSCHFIHADYYHSKPETESLPKPYMAFDTVDVTGHSTFLFMGGESIESGGAYREQQRLGKYFDSQSSFYFGLRQVYTPVRWVGLTASISHTIYDTHAFDSLTLNNEENERLTIETFNSNQLRLGIELHPLNSFKLHRHSFFYLALYGIVHKTGIKEEWCELFDIPCKTRYGWGYGGALGYRYMLGNLFFNLETSMQQLDEQWVSGTPSLDRVT